MLYKLYCWVCDRTTDINDESGTCPACGANLLHCTDYSMNIEG